MANKFDEYEIRKRLESLAGKFAPFVTNIARVKDVDTNECTCILIDEDGQEFYDVRLRPITGGNNGFLQVPEINSLVLAVRIENGDEWMVVACDKINSVQIKIGNENMITLINDFVDAIRNMSFTTNTGCTIKLINDFQFIELKKRINNVIR
ncbi:hypothetical protein [Apibacter adventoris]|uniref:hypothetical protein n=1 Tax=Apibacter adventoris TaxID=1679466 RepID=UPI000CF67725|nr:hypothetical protein [Apibacter adventoris]PQL95204.1 hypothetical protein C4S76_03185 [Apibacter adventoris]